jgi:hypothetical protein
MSSGAAAFGAGSRAFVAGTGARTAADDAGTGGAATFGLGAVTAGGIVRGATPEDRGSFPGFPDLESRPSILDVEGGVLNAGGFDFGGATGALTTGGIVRGARSEDRGSFPGFPDLESRPSILDVEGGVLNAGGFDFGGATGALTTGGIVRGSIPEDRGSFPGFPDLESRPSVLDVEDAAVAPWAGSGARACCDCGAGTTGVADLVLEYHW